MEWEPRLIISLFRLIRVHLLICGQFPVSQLDLAASGNGKGA
jgi:hypothetical protein